MLDFDPTRTYAEIGRRLERETDPRRRAMLEKLYAHSRGEVEGDLEAVLGTLAPYPIYKGVRQSGPQPEGMDQVRAFYIDEIFGAGRHVLESVKERIVIDDDTIITEGPLRMLRWGRDLIREGITVDDPDGVYILSAQLLIVWPYDAEARIIGEESYGRLVAEPLQKVADADVPDYFRAYIRGKREAEPA